MATFPDSSSSTTKDIPFAELHCLSNYSFLQSASHPEEMMLQAAKLGYQALAITDECSVSGVVKAHLATKKPSFGEAKIADIKLIVGSEFRLDEDIKLILLAPNRLAYGQLCTLITKGRRRSPKGEYELHLNDFTWGLGECLVLWVPSSEQATCGIENLMQQGKTLKELFAKLWIALELFHEADDLDKMANALTLSMRLNLPITAANDVRMHARARKPLHDVLTATRLKTTVANLGGETHGNAERHLRSIDELLNLYPQEMLFEAHTIAAQCHFSLDELRYEYPEELVPPHLNATDYLRQLTFAGAKERWPDGTPKSVRKLIEKELVLIKTLNFEHYFLTVQDIVQFARSQGILCQGRGSAANSAVCYCLHVTEVDPARMRLLFERFISAERDEPPDIDVDFEHERREEVIQYLYKRYSRERAALAATLITYRPRSAIRDVGKALGMDLDLVGLLAKSMAWWDKRSELDVRFREAGLNPKSKLAKQFLVLVEQILGFPRHLSQHVGGFVISRGPLSQLVPLENAAMEDRTVIQWDKYDLEALGLLKIDILGLGMLTAIRKTMDDISNFRGLEGDKRLRLQDIPAEDPETYKMLQKGDSIGVFQVESRAQMSMLPRLKPAKFYDLVIEVAIVRPGPIQGDMVHPYLRRRQGIEKVEYSNDRVRAVLERTLGVPIFQEQVIELAMVAAGFSAGEADQLRRAMAAWSRRGGLEHFENKLINGMLERGETQEFAERIFRQIQGFGEYGFPESHAASFALLVYFSAWLKRHEPAAFYCGLLNSLPMGFYSPSQLIQDAKRHHIEVRDVCVQESTWDHHLQAEQIPQQEGQGALRLGLRLIKGLNEQAGKRIADCRPFVDAEDLGRRASLNQQTLTFLARAGALKNLAGHRYQAHWDVAGIEKPNELQRVADANPQYHTDVALPGPGAGEDVLADYRYLSLSLGPHPMAILRPKKSFAGCRQATELESYRQGQFVRIAGIVTGRQRPGTATGVLFLTLEDETDNMNVVVWSSVLTQFRAALLQGQLLKVKGIVEREASVIHVVAGHIEDMTYELSALANQPTHQKEELNSFKSRDFR